MKDKIFMILLGIIAVNLTYLSLNLKDIDFSQSQDKPAFINPFEPDEDGVVSFTPEELKYLKHVLHSTDTYTIARGEQIYFPGVRNCYYCHIYTSPSPRDGLLSRMPSSA